jgi:hypothetical protein
LVGVALHLDRRLHALQVIFALDGTHQNLLPPIVMAVRGDAAIKANAVNQQVYMLVFCIEVARHDVLVVLQSHALQVMRGDLPPLVIAQMLAGAADSDTCRTALPTLGRRLRTSPNSFASSRGVVPLILVSITLPCSLFRSQANAPRKPRPLTALAIIALSLYSKEG